MSEESLEDRQNNEYEALKVNNSFHLFIKSSHISVYY